MSGSQSDDSVNSDYQLVVTFKLDGSAGMEVRTSHGHVRFPPGGGDRVQHLTIGKVQLTGIPEDEAAEIIRKRSEALALIGQAMAVAGIQYADEVAAWSRTQQPNDSADGKSAAC